MFFCARMAESADATDLKSVGKLNSCASSSLAPGIFTYFRSSDPILIEE